MNMYVIVIISKKLRTKNLTYTSYRLKMLKCQIDYNIKSYKISKMYNFKCSV